ncbi:hypothetical protein [Microcoleus sp. BROC3]|uniref:hypothetical protein n=1 Tax=Microcoleus sp. BROC3 TaxID=3055323 RepID=UPI002FD47C4E
MEEVEVADESPDVEKGVKLGFVSPGACVAGETLTVSGKIILPFFESVIYITVED